jgi:hypothetical protein
MGFQVLTADERSALIADGQKAWQDPDVQAAAEKMRDATTALDDAILEKEVSLRPILDKVTATDTLGGGSQRLTADEREQLRAARESMKNSPEARALKAATAEYQRTTRRALIAVDPSIAAILDKLPRGNMGMGPGLRRVMGPEPTSSPAASPSAAAPSPSGNAARS